jgi:hypothetical protein
VADVECCPIGWDEYLQAEKRQGPKAEVVPVAAIVGAVARLNW